MPVVQVEAQLSTDELLKAADQLSQSELEQFARQVIALRARRQAPCLPHVEAKLLIKINQGADPDVQQRYDELIEKRQAESLSSDEYQELLRLSDEIEKVNAHRMEYLAELARLRQMSLTELMEDLGLQSPAYA